MRAPAEYRKALAALVLGAAGALGTAMLDGAVSVPELVAALGAGLVAGGATYTVRNRDA